MFDTKCYQLAHDFYFDHPEVSTPQRVNKLAQLIQDTIEGEIAMQEQGGPYGDCVDCDNYILAESEAPYCPTCARLKREGSEL